MKVIILFNAQLGWRLQENINPMPEFFQHVSSSLNNVYFVTFGDSYDFPIGTHINEVIFKLLGYDEKPIVIHLTIWDNYLVVNGLKEYSGIKILDTEDQMNIEYIYPFMDIFNVILYRVETKMIQMVKDLYKNHRFFHVPFFKNKNQFKDHKLKKEYDLFFSSAYSFHNSSYYLRRRLYEIFTRQNKYKIVVSENSSVGKNQAFSEMINKSWLTISTPTINDKNAPNERNTNYYVAKYIEIPMSKGVVLGYLPNVAKNDYKNNYVYVTEEMSDEEIIKIVDDALNNKKKLIEYSDNLYDYFQTTYSFENGVKIFQEIISDITTIVKPYNSRNDYNDYQFEYTNSINKIIQSGEFINGSSIKILEDTLSNYIGIKHCITCANGTDALLIALLALDINAGDEIITTPFSWISTSQVIILRGAIPVFVDINPDTYNISVELIEKAITNKTKAILPVSLFGKSCDIQEIMNIAEKHNLFVIEDAAQSMGAIYKNKKSCSIAHISCTSFYPTKPLGCWGDGGACFTNDDNIALKMQKIRNHGCLDRYEHDLIGINSRLDSIQAAILNVKMTHFDKLLENRISIGDKYSYELKEIEEIVLPKNNYGKHVYAQYCILLKDKETRDDFIHYMQVNGIILQIFYPKLLYEFKTIEKFKTSCPNAENICNRIVSLTCYDSMPLFEQNKIIKYTKLYFK
jgi:UDP-2-acetamido-2-deoxy-ribo-hexuluronate aminotransferase